MTDIPEDVMKAAMNAFDEAPPGQGHYTTIARAILAERELLAKALRDVVYQQPGDIGAYSRAASLLHSIGMAQKDPPLTP